MTSRREKCWPQAKLQAGKKWPWLEPLATSGDLGDWGIGHGAWGMGEEGIGHGAWRKEGWGMGHRAWGMGHGD
ncbi:MAG: hypothetical protein D5S03_08040 [Desulfonatronospira sp. MSAO_Bac3]|nr:MAG: hypothetical protein D5S03_08040 [Desulfonatronospira sp. MSAO_Bac3]